MEAKSGENWIPEKPPAFDRIMRDLNIFPFLTALSLIPTSR
jgi:hypothetical protein